MVSYITKADLIQSPQSTEARKVIGLALRSRPVSKEVAIKLLAIPSQVNLKLYKHPVHVLTACYNTLFLHREIA